MNFEYLQVVVDVSHVAPVAEGLSVGPFGLDDAAVRAQHVSQVTVRCNKPKNIRFYYICATKFNSSKKARIKSDRAYQACTLAHTHTTRITRQWA